jgi:hypothetical protein
MPKKCIICNEKAVFAIKGTSDFYCENCAEENFDDLTCLEKIKEHEGALLDDAENEELAPERAEEEEDDSEPGEKQDIEKEGEDKPEASGEGDNAKEMQEALEAESIERMDEGFTEIQYDDDQDDEDEEPGKEEEKEKIDIEPNEKPMV